MKRRGKGRPIDGILLLDKPSGLSSNAALQRVKRLYRARKAGHTGNLDPLATGMLPICLGGATKVSAFLLDAEKTYRITGRIGRATSTGDAEGEVVETGSEDESLLTGLEEVLEGFRGRIEQVPPMYSALKHKGERLYNLARKGIEVEREPRPVEIHELRVVELRGTEFELHVRCSKGTYVRTLIEDIARALGTCGHATALRRLGVGPYQNETMWSLDELERRAESSREALDELLLPVDSALRQWPAVELNADAAFHLRRGQPVLVPSAPMEGWVRLYDGQSSRFMGMGEVIDDGRVAPRRLMLAPGRDPDLVRAGRDG